MRELLVLVAALGCGPVTNATMDAARSADVSGFIVGPVVQNAGPETFGVMWEIEDGIESVVEYGPTPELGMKALGEVIDAPGSRTIHHVTLTGLVPSTTYYYRASSGEAKSRIFRMKTPPMRGEKAPFRFAVYSDCQQQPGIHRQIADQGILGSLPRGKDPSDELAFALIAGDVVQDGDDYRQYEERLFGPVRNLAPHAPLYTAIGNHERDSRYYFDYLNLPRNGSPGFEEHWYSFDHGNAHVIGLDTNAKYSTILQLDWLEQDLAKVCHDPAIDMVFAFFHHPHRSELWLDGETPYSGSIVEKVERTVASCNKLGAYFFGHTHGYSRGQSKDTSFYHVNVGTAGGHIDYWDQFRQRDYPEFQKSFDEYGVLMVEANVGGKAGFSAKRLTFGDDKIVKAGEIQDEFTLTRGNLAPDKPVIAHAALSGGKLTAQASAYRDPEDERHLESEWQASTEPTFTATVATDWLRYENWFKDRDTAAGTDLTAWTTAVEGAATWVRVRYRDDGLGWSPWSEPHAVGKPLARK